MADGPRPNTDNTIRAAHTDNNCHIVGLIRARACDQSFNSFIALQPHISPLHRPNLRGTLLFFTMCFNFFVIFATAFKKAEYLSLVWHIIYERNRKLMKKSLK